MKDDSHGVATLIFFSKIKEMQFQGGNETLMSLTTTIQTFHALQVFVPSSIKHQSK